MMVTGDGKWSSSVLDLLRMIAKTEVEGSLSESLKNTARIATMLTGARKAGIFLRQDGLLGLVASSGVSASESGVLSMIQTQGLGKRETGTSLLLPRDTLPLGLSGLPGEWKTSSAWVPIMVEGKESGFLGVAGFPGAEIRTDDRELIRLLAL